MEGNCHIIGEIIISLGGIMKVKIVLGIWYQQMLRNLLAGLLFTTDILLPSLSFFLVNWVFSTIQIVQFHQNTTLHIIFTHKKGYNPENGTPLLHQYIQSIIGTGSSDE